MKNIVTWLFIISITSITAMAQEEPPEKIKSYVPDFVVGQYAGSIGFISLGAGYDIFKNNLRVDLLLGYVPGFTGSKPLETFTLKLTGSAGKRKLNSKVLVHPLNFGTYFSYTFGREYSTDLPSWYPKGYYWWSEAIRVNMFLGSSVEINTDRLRTGSRLSPYFEIGTNEIKLISYAQNTGSLSFWNILHAGIGVRYIF
jgi:hypothetical protein